MHDHGLNGGTLALALALIAGCPADGDGDTDSGASGSTGSVASTGGVNPTAGEGTASSASGSGSTDPTREGTSTGSRGTTSGAETTDGTTRGGGESSGSTGGDASSSEGGSSSSSGEPETTGPLEEYACDGYWFAACSFCLQTECMPELIACEESGGCCCLTYCLAGGLEPELCMAECGVEEYPVAADELMACKINECGAGGQCPKD